MDYLFIQKNSPDGGFLQSEQWLRFQEEAGHKTFCFSSNTNPSPKGEGEFGFYASIIEHNLPIAGKYFYVPKGPVVENQKSKNPVKKEFTPGEKNQKYNLELKFFLKNLINLARKEKAGWIRIDPASEEILESIKKAVSEVSPRKLQGLTSIKKAPHDMQPREILIIDITKTEEELLVQMKAKTRYNIRLAEKKGVSLRIANLCENTNSEDMKEFLKLVKITAKRDKIKPHPESYYRKMFETIPPEILKLYVAEYEGKIIAANMVIFFGNTATYLHGTSDYRYRNLMAPYLLQWQAILDAKKAGFARYDFGGVKILQLVTCDSQLKKKKIVSSFKFQVSRNDWQGITKFKTGFAPNIAPIEFPGSYDIILNPFKYHLYRILQKIKSFA